MVSSVQQKNLEMHRTCNKAWHLYTQNTWKNIQFHFAVPFFILFLPCCWKTFGYLSVQYAIINPIDHMQYAYTSFRQYTTLQTLYDAFVRIHLGWNWHTKEKCIHFALLRFPNQSIYVEDESEHIQVLYKVHFHSNWKWASSRSGGKISQFNILSEAIQCFYFNISNAIISPRYCINIFSRGLKPVEVHIKRFELNTEMDSKCMGERNAVDRCGITTKS